MMPRWMVVLNLYKNIKLEESNMGETSNKHVHYDMILEWAANPKRTVQLKNSFGWVDCSPTWNPVMEYRFKPVPQIQYYHLISTKDSFGRIIVLLQKSNEYNWLIDEKEIISISKSFRVEDGVFPGFLENRPVEEGNTIDNSI